jgi:hypothetical protein
VELPDLAFAVSSDRENAFGPLDGFRLRLHFNHSHSANKLLRLRKGAVDNGELTAVDADARALRARLTSFGLHEHPGLRHLAD